MYLSAALWFVLFLKCVSCKKYFVVPSQPSSRCLIESCRALTLSQFADNFYMNNTYSNTTLFMLQGNHSLPAPIVISNIASFALILLANNSNSSAQIICSESANFVMSNISSVRISGIAFLGCGRNQFQSVKNLTIHHSKFIGQNNSQTPLVITESKAHLILSLFAFNEVGSYYHHFQFSRYLPLKLSGSFTAKVGGVVIVNSTVLAIQNCVFKNNSANIGGAIFSISKSIISITDSVFTHNYAKNHDSRLCFGGSFFVDGNPGRIKIHSSTFNNGQSVGDGGVGFVFDTVLEVSQSKFNNNVAERFGGVMRILNCSSITIDSSFFNHNRAYGDGGAIITDGNSNVILKSSMFFDNSAAEYGGVLFLQLSCVLIINTAIQNNRAKSGGAIYANTNSNITINYSKFTYNQATSDYKDVVLNEGGVVLLNKNSTLNINHSTFMYNTAKIGGGVISSFVSAHVYRSTIKSSNFSSNVAGHYGGVAHLQYGSSIEIFDSNFENNQASRDGGVFDCFNLSYVKVNHSRFINNRAGYHGGVLSAKVMSNFHCEKSVFYTNTGDTLGGIVYISDKSKLTLCGCLISHNRARYGGAIVSDRNGILTIFNSTFSSNTGKINGGIFYVRDNCKIAINSSHFFNNTVYNDGLMKVADSSSILLSRCNISGNKAVHSGIVYAYDNSSITVDSCNFINNEVGDSGGALYGRRNSNITIIKSEIINCTAQKLGGSVVIQHESNAMISDSSFTSSSANDGGVVNAYQSNVVITDCKFSNNMASTAGGVLSAVKASRIAVQKTNFTLNLGGYGGVAFAFQNSQLAFEHCEFLNNKAEFEGIITIRQQSILTVTKSIFKNNTAENGAVIYLQASNATIKESVYDANEAKIRGGVIYGCDCSTIEIYFDTFCRNKARNDGGVVALLGRSAADIERSTFIANRANSNGGTIFTQESLVDISNCTFNFSSAVSGGIMYATYGTLKISNSSFYYNNASGSGGVVEANAVKSLEVFWSNFVFSTAHKYGGALHLLEYSNATISYSLFEENKANMYGGAISAYSMSTAVIINCTFDRNDAENGGALAAQASSICIDRGDVNDETIIHDNRASFGSGIYLAQSSLNFSMKTNFSHNQASLLGGGIHAVNSSIFIDSKVEFKNNQAKSGGGVSLANSILYDKTNHTTTINFISNHAAVYGGAIYVDDKAVSMRLCSTDSYSSPAAKCFFQSTGNHLKIYLSENDANVIGQDLFGGLLDRCTVNTVAGIAYFREMSNLTRFNSDTVSSEPVQVCLCNDSNKANCDQQIHKLKVRQRDPFNISVVAVDQVGNYVPALLHSSLKDVSLPVSQTLRKISSNCTAMNYEVSFVNANEDHELTLYAEGPCADNGVSKLSITVNVIPCSCAPGFVPANKRTECVCICDRQDKVLLEYIKECNSFTESVIREGTFWITYLHHADDMNNSGSFFVFPYCPMDYCQPSSKPVSINFNYHDGSDAQCANNRAGVLCGRCRANYSLSLGTSRCIKCPKNWYGQLVGIIIAMFFAGIALVFLILWLNLTVALGTLNSIIFYANIIDANKSIYFSKTHTCAVKVFVSWLSLDLGIDACYVKGMDTFTKTWLQLVFPAYIISLVIITICISSYSFKLSSTLGKKNPVETLATLILLSYTKLLKTIITSFSFAIFRYPNGTKTYQWLPDASVDYGKGKHIALICIATIILIFGLFYTFVIFLWQWLLHCSNLKWTKNLKFHLFIATYHIPNIAKHRYWTGLLLLVRVLVYLISTFTVSVDPKITLLSTIVIMCCLQMYKTVFLVRVYRNKLLSSMESFVLYNITIFTTITWYTFDDIQYSKSKELLQRTVTYVSVGTVAFSCFLVICFHVYRYGNKTLYLLGQNTKLCKKLIQRYQISQDWIKEPRTTADRESDVYQLFDISYSYQDNGDGYSPPPAHPHKQPTSSSISLADGEEL